MSLLIVAIQMAILLFLVALAMYAVYDYLVGNLRGELEKELFPEIRQKVIEEVITDVNKCLSAMREKDWGYWEHSRVVYSKYRDEIYVSRYDPIEGYVEGDLGVCFDMRNTWKGPGFNMTEDKLLGRLSKYNQINDTPTEPSCNCDKPIYTQPPSVGTRNGL